ncbi:hypothetical protein [Vibrio sp. 10N.261.52.A1]|uniref:hypothetical protein n=1 Tax=Vibrio TaxID=662 RepID=UPI001054C16F|nr:hypothetical protein [Vibrio sp. 10N.261.52.A1]
MMYRKFCHILNQYHKGNTRNVPGGTMKHFLPSSVMLTPFLVKYYDEEPQEASDSPGKKESQVECTVNPAQESTQEEHEPALTE